MDSIVEFVGPTQALQLFGVKLVGVNAENGKKLLLTLIFIALIFSVRWVVHKISSTVWKDKEQNRLLFWTRQGVKLFTALFILVGIASIWFDDPARLTTAFGLITAGLAFALQKVVTAVAGYFVILRGKTFNVGDRITMGGVRGDVIALDFTQTTLMEMGQPPAVQNADPAMWVKSRQYTGRVVTVTNAKVFDEPIYNYTRDFPYIWEEMSIPISYKDDRAEAEKILLETANKYTVEIEKLSEEAIGEMKRRYFLAKTELHPHVYLRLTDNWVELTVRFIAPDRGIRDIKDKMSREILQRLEENRIGIASATFEIVGLPDLKIKSIEAPGKIPQSPGTSQQLDI